MKQTKANCGQIGMYENEKIAVKHNVNHQNVRSSNGKQSANHTSPEVYLQKLLRKNYEFRYNVITEQVEYRTKTGPNDFSLLDKRRINSLCLELMEQGVKCWDKDVLRFVYSSRIQDYHPFQLYMKELPAWDGKDRVEPLIRRVTQEPICIRAMYHWLIAWWLNGWKSVKDREIA